MCPPTVGIPVFDLAVTMYAREVKWYRMSACVVTTGTFDRQPFECM